MSHLVTRILDAYRCGAKELLPLVASHLSNLEISNVNLTGAGIYADLTPKERDLPPICPEYAAISGVELFHPKLELGAGSVLFVTRGVIDLLEVYLNGMEEWPIDEDQFAIKINKLLVVSREPAGN